MALIARNVAAERGGRLALAAPDFQVLDGEAAVVTGPNGAGKSTLLRVLAALTPALRGEIELDGVSLAADRDAYAVNVAYSGHLDAVKPALSVRANLASWAAIYGGRGGGVDEALALFGLDRIADAPAAFCSAGQKRRLGLARLKVVDRRLWLLDEPTVSLDAASAATFADMVAEHCAAGGLAVAATHIDLGLPDGPRIEIAPAVAADADAADPFMAGDWG